MKDFAHRLARAEVVVTVARLLVAQTLRNCPRCCDPAQLARPHPGAAASLREGAEETLTVMRLGLPENLERVLSSTNLIENLFSRVREIGRRVKRWQGGTMVLRWTAAGVLEAERGFRKLAGYRAMPTLVAALRAHDNQFNRNRRVDVTDKAA